MRHLLLAYMVYWLIFRLATSRSLISFVVAVAALEAFGVGVVVPTVAWITELALSVFDTVMNALSDQLTSAIRGAI